MASEEELMPGIVLKRLDTSSNDDSLPSPEFNQWVRFTWVGCLMSGEVFSPERESWGKIGDGDVCPGLELALRSIRLRDRAVVEVEARFAFGNIGRPAAKVCDVALPSDTPVKFEIMVLELGSIGPPGSFPLDSDRLSEAGRKRIIGNGCFLYKDYERSARCYGAALKAVDGILGSEDDPHTPKDSRVTVMQLMLDCGNNLAAAYLKLLNYPKAEAACVAVLEIDPSNVKALYRGGSAAMEQHKYVEARLAFERVREIAPDDHAGARKFLELEKREEAYKSKELRMMKQMSSNLFAAKKGDSQKTIPCQVDILKGEKGHSETDEQPWPSEDTQKIECADEVDEGGEANLGTGENTEPWQTSVFVLGGIGCVLAVATAVWFSMGN